MVRKCSAFIALNITVRFSDYNYRWPQTYCGSDIDVYDMYWHTLFNLCRNKNLKIILFYINFELITESFY